MKTPASFKLSKEVKRFLSFIADKGRRAEVRKLFIEAEYAKETLARRKVREKAPE